MSSATLAPIKIEYFHGHECTWHGEIYNTMMSRGRRMCPHCAGALTSVPSVEQWDETHRQFNEVVPGHFSFMKWLKGQCFRDVDQARRKYLQEHPEAGFQFTEYLERQREWSANTFGPDDRLQGVLDHLRKELIEVENDPKDASEWNDLIILACDGAMRQGIAPADIVKGLMAKQEKNFARTWPDWRTADPNKAIEHDRSKD